MRRRLRHQVERRPLLWVSGIAFAAVLGADGALVPAGLLGGLLLGCVGFSKVWRVLVAGLLVAWWSAERHQDSLAERDLMRGRLGRVEMVEARVLEVPRVFVNGRWSSSAVIDGGRHKAQLEGVGRVPEEGAVVRGLGRFESPEKARNPGGYDRKTWLERQGIAVVFHFNGPPETLSLPPRPVEWGKNLKQGFREAVTRGLDPLSEEAMVIRAVVLGEHPEDDILIEPFRQTGTLHVFAVSGLHVGMVGLMGWSLLRLCGVPHRRALVPLLVLMFGYAWLTGMKPPAVRAAWMAAVVLGAFALRRRPDAGNALGFAALLVLLVNADLVFTIGVQLSFGVVLAIWVMHPFVVGRMAWLSKEEPYLPRSLYGPLREAWLKLRRWLANGLSVSTAAWLGSAPLTAIHFGIVTPISIVASLVLSLIVFPLLGIALLSAAGNAVPGWSVGLNHVNAKLARMMLSSARCGADVPGGHFSVPRDRPADEFLLVFDVGSDGAACWAGKGGSVLVDGASRYRFDRDVLPALRRMGVRPDALVASHPDGGHVGGLISAVDAFPVAQSLVPVERALGSTYREWLAVSEARGVRRIVGKQGNRYAIGDDAWIEVLGETDGLDWLRIADERIMPVKLHWRGWKILFVSDQGWAGERRLLKSGADLSADLIVAGRHEYDNSLGDEFLQATGARIVVATHADFPGSERIPAGWRNACEARGIRVIHQGESGAVVVTASREKLTVRGWMDGRVVEIDHADDRDEITDQAGP